MNKSNTSAFKGKLNSNYTKCFEVDKTFVKYLKLKPAISNLL